MDAEHFPTLADIQRAQTSLDGVARRTPLLESDTLSKLTGRLVFLKSENLQRTGSYKIRGAYNRIVGLSGEERARSSSGAITRRRTLVRLLTPLVEKRANVLDIEHRREAWGLPVDVSEVLLHVETRGPEHRDEIIATLRSLGFAVEPILSIGQSSRIEA